MSTEKTPAKPEKEMAKKPATAENTSSKGGGKGLTIVLLLLVLALGGGLIFMYMENQKLKEIGVAQTGTIEKQEDKIEDQFSELQELSDNYERVMAERDALGLANDSARAELDLLTSKIKALRSRAWKSEEEKKKLQRELDRVMAEYTLKLTEKDEEIARLTMLSDSLKTNIDTLLGEKANMLAENASLADKVALASVLEAEGLKVVTVNAKGKEFDKEIHKAKNIATVKLSFVVGANDVSPKEEKEVFMLLKDPAGTVLFDINRGGGAFTQVDGNQAFFSKKTRFEFNNENEMVTFEYELGEDETFIPGTYAIELFESGYKIGETALQVK